MSSEAIGKKDLSRRDLLGLTAIGTATIAGLATLGGSLRLVKPNVHFEESTQFKIGKPENFPEGTVRVFDDKNCFIFSDSDGLYAVSSICTHLGCIVSLTEWGFQCPCHGSKYNPEGHVIGGPAPRSLEWFEINQDVDGSLVVDSAKTVAAGTKYIFT